MALGRLLAAILLAVVGLGVTSEAVAAHEPEPTPASDEARGLRPLGLEPPRPDGPCGAARFEVRAPGGAVACTHGPDPAPDGVDVRGSRSVAELAATLDAGSTTGTVEADGVPCIGTGTSGARVSAVYGYVAGATDRWAEIAPLIRGWAAEADRLVDLSAGQTAGSRHLRWEQDAACRVVVRRVAFSANAATDLGQMMAELQQAGLDRADRRYLVWFDADYLCGVAVNMTDDSPSQSNLNNGVPTGIVHFGHVDRGCWGVVAPKNQVELHEIMHTIGAVQPSSPNSSSVPLGDGEYAVYGHCVDEHETMCYADGSPKPLVERCPESNERYLDCRHDDYFHTAPPATSYLASHWNSAMSIFLARVDPVGGFLDVDRSMFRGDIGWIAASGITRGCSADQERYCPTSTVTREQMASFLVRALGLPPSSVDAFDDDEDSIHEGPINALAASGITGGCAADRFCPTATVTREQMASFLHRGFAP